MLGFTGSGAELMLSTTSLFRQEKVWPQAEPRRPSSAAGDPRDLSSSKPGSAQLTWEAEAQQLVVLIHGLGANRWLMSPLKAQLSGYGYQTSTFGYGSIRGSIEKLAQRLRQRLVEYSQQNSIRRIHIVGHSLGGILARAVLSERRIEKVTRMVMLGPPNQGSRVAAVLAGGLQLLCPALAELSDAPDSLVNQLGEPDGVQTGIIAAKDDRVVAVERTILPSMSDHIVVPGGHTTMLFRQDVANLVAAFLRSGRFQP